MINQLNKLLLILLLVPQLLFAQAATSPPTDNGSSNGPSIDRTGAPVVDPTKNVIDLVRAQGDRSDDRFKYREEISDLKGIIADLKTTHNAEITKLYADYQKRADDKESARIDAIIASDRSAAKNEVDRSQKAVDTVATLQTATAETLRSAVATTAAGIATQFAQTTSALVERIAALEKAQYTGQGRSTVADPQVEALRLQVESQRSQVESINRLQAQGTGKSEGINATWVLLGTILTIGIGVVAIIATRRKPNQPN